MKNKTVHNNQSGQAAIMFAVIMSIILCLLSIGFATLSRNDQLQTLDKTLSFQATYAAETAINTIQQAYQANPNFQQNSNCSNDTQSSLNTALSKAFTDNNSSALVKITCLIWTDQLLSLQNSSLSGIPWLVPIIPSAGVITRLEIKWQPITAPGNLNLNNHSTSQLTLNNGNLPTIRIAAAESGDISNAGIIYINPASVSNPTASIAAGINNTGTITNAQCGNSKPWQCIVYLNLNQFTHGSWTSGWLSITSLNGSSSVTVSAFDQSGNSVVLEGAQVKVDATAESQDVIKRLIAYPAISKSTWQPGFAASADYLCKNYAVGSVNNDQAYDSPSSSNPNMVSSSPCPE